MYHTIMVNLGQGWRFPIAIGQIQIAKAGIVEIEKKKGIFFTIYLFEK